MRKIIAILVLVVALLPVAAALCARASEIDDDLFAKRRVFSSIGPGLRAVRHAPNGHYYVLASPTVGIAVFDANGKRLFLFGAAPEAPVPSKAGRAPIGFGEDCDIDPQGHVYVADRAYNLISVFSSDGNQLRSFPVNALVSVAALPDGEVAVSTLDQPHAVTVYGPNGKVAREFGNADSLASRPELNHYLNLGRVASDPQGHIYYGFTYLPEPLVRQFDRSGTAGQEFEFTGLDAFPEAQATRKAIEREDSRSDPPSLPKILTAYGVDPVNGDVWMGLHNTLVHFDRDGIRRSEYQIYTPNGTRLDASVILVEQERLLIGSDPLGVYEFPRPDRKH
jgi:hypothetical protein